MIFLISANDEHSATRIDFKIAARRRLVTVILTPHRDKVSGLHLDEAIEPWLAERGFSNNHHDGVIVESA